MALPTCPVPASVDRSGHRVDPVVLVPVGGVALQRVTGRVTGRVLEDPDAGVDVRVRDVGDQLVAGARRDVDASAVADRALVLVGDVAREDVVVGAVEDADARRRVAVRDVADQPVAVDPN